MSSMGVKMMEKLKMYGFTPGIIAALVGAILVMLLGLLVMTYGKRIKKRSVESKNDLFFYKLYFEYKKIPVAKSYIRKLTRQLQKMSVYTKKEVFTMVSRYFTLTATIVVCTIVIALFLFEDVVSVGLCSMLAYLLPTVIIEHRISRTNHIVYTQMKYAVESLRLEYLRCNNVVEALVNVEVGKRLTRIFEEIYGVLVAADGALRLKEFYELTPFRPIQTLAQICYHINNTGDQVDEHGNSAFVDALLVMTSDINQELERLDYQKLKFGKVEYLCLLPIPSIKIIESFLSANMPGTVVIYKGPVGYFLHVVIILTSIMTFSITARINNVSSLKEDDRIPFFKRLLTYPFIYRFLKNVCPKNAKRRKISRRLFHAFSKKTVEEFYIEKLLYAIAAFIIVISTILSGIRLGYDFMIHNTQSLDLLASEKDIRYTEEDILNMDYEYISQRDAGVIFNEEDISMFIKSYMPTLSDIKIQDQKSRLEKKYAFLKQMYFSWFFIPIAFLVAIVAWNIPNKALKSREKTLKGEEEEEFLQIQTLMIILMSMNCDTMEAIEYLSQLTRVHKEMFLCGYHSYASNPVEALLKMEVKTPIPDFKRFINKLKLTVDELSLIDAFSDLKMNREHIARSRDVVLRESIDSKRRYVGGLVKIGVTMTVILLFMFPLLYLGMRDLMGGLNTLQAL